MSDPKDPIAILEYGIYALVNSGRMTYEECQPAVDLLKEIKDGNDRLAKFMRVKPVNEKEKDAYANAIAYQKVHGTQYHDDILGI